MADLTATPLSEVTHEGITVVGRDTEAQMREELGLPAETVQEPSQPVAAPVEPQPSDPPKETAQQKHDRIQRLTWEREEAKRQAKELAEENARLKAPQKPAEPRRPQIQEFPDDPTDPMPREEDFEVYRDYVRAEAQWNSRQTYKALRHTEFENARRARVQQARHQVDSDFATALADYSAKNPAFASKVESSDLFISEPMKDGLKASKTPQLMEYLIDNPKEVERITQLRPIDQYAEMRILASRLTAAPAGSAVAARPTTKAEPPINPVSGSHVVPKDDGPPGDDATDEEYFAWRDKQSRKRA